MKIVWSDCLLSNSAHTTPEWSKEELKRAFSTLYNFRSILICLWATFGVIFLWNLNNIIKLSAYLQVASGYEVCSHVQEKKSYSRLN